MSDYGVTLDFETADRITLCVLKDQLEYLEKEIAWFEAPEAEREGYMYVHPDDYLKNKTELIPALRTLIAFFGG